MTPQEQKNVETIQNSINLIKNFIRFDEISAKLAELEKQIEAPDFWDNTENAIKTTKEKDDITETIKPVKN